MSFGQNIRLHTKGLVLAEHLLKSLEGKCVPSDLDKQRLHFPPTYEVNVAYNRLIDALFDFQAFFSSIRLN